MKKLLLSLVLLLALAPAIADNQGKIVFLSSASTAATRNSSDFYNPSGHCGAMVVDITALTTGTFTFTIQGKDPASGKYYTALASPALNGVATNVYKICPGMTASANSVANDAWPQVWRINVAGASTPVGTYSVGVLIQ